MGVNLEYIARGLVIAGLVIAAIGMVLLFLPKIPYLGDYIGRLPGDIYVKRKNFTFYFPITTSIIISVVISLLLYLFRK